MIQPSHVVMFSTGVGSYLAALRVISEYGGDSVTLLFTDVGDGSSEHSGEDADNYRFLDDVRREVEELGARVVTLGGDEDVWSVFKRRRRIGSARVANCSTELKQRPAREWLNANCPDAALTTIYIGIDWSETHRIPSIERAYAPRPVRFPMTEVPLLDKEKMLEECISRGIKPPKMYEYGFPHANCGGFCVRAGQAQFAKLLELMPDRYAYHEDKEEELRSFLGKDVAILRDRRGGTTKPLTLRAFRLRIAEERNAFDQDDWGGCGCFVTEESQ